MENDEKNKGQTKDKEKWKAYHGISYVAAIIILTVAVLFGAICGVWAVSEYRRLHTAEQQLESLSKQVAQIDQNLSTLLDEKRMQGTESGVDTTDLKSELPETESESLSLMQAQYSSFSDQITLLLTILLYVYQFSLLHFLLLTM